MKIGFVEDRMNSDRTSPQKTVSIGDASFLECSRTTRSQIQRYAQANGVSMASIVDEALQDWMTCVAPARQAAQRTQGLRRRG
jgi:hypothetical protein